MTVAGCSTRVLSHGLLSRFCLGLQRYGAAGRLSRVCIGCLLNQVKTEQRRYRIGELSRRSGVSVELLRAWETRYALVEPQRTAGGFRLYSDRDGSRVRRMQALLRQGLSAAQAAREVLDNDGRTLRTKTVPAGLVDDIDRALLAFDEPGAHEALDRLFSTVELEDALQDAILPELRSIGDRWATGAVSVAQEHFSATLIRGRLLALARGWDRGRGRRAVLACLPGELHDIGLIAFGIVLRQQGWRILYLGQDTPIGTAAATAKRTRADALILVAVGSRHFRAVADEALDLPRGTAIAIGGAGATASVARRMGAVLLGPELTAGAGQLVVGRSAAKRGPVLR